MDQPCLKHERPECICCNAVELCISYLQFPRWKCMWIPLTEASNRSHNMRQPSLKAFSSALVVLIIAECVLGLPSTSAAPTKSESIRDKTCLATPKQSPIRNLRLYIPLGVGAVASMAVGIVSTTTPFIPCLLLAEFLVAAALFDWKASQYQSLIADNTIDIDQYTCSRPSMYDRAKVIRLLFIKKRWQTCDRWWRSMASQSAITRDP